MGSQLLKWIAGGVVLTGLGISGASAGDRPFAFAYGTDMEPAGEAELEQEITWASGHAHEAFQAIESRTEFEYAISNKFQASFYLTYNWERTRPHPVGGPAETESLPGLSSEFIYQVWDAKSDPIGFALYAEPSIGNGTRSVELKALFQKNFLNDRLRAVLNLNVEDEWEKNGLGQYDESSALEFYTGIAYAVSPDWSIAAELDNERGFDGLLLGGTSRYAENAYYFGPALSYTGEPFSLILAAQMQMPWASDPTHTAGALSGGYLAGAERFRVRLRLAKDL